MVSLEELKQIVLMRYLTDAMLENLRSHIDILHFVQEEVIFREGDKANRLYLLKRGKVLLEKKCRKKSPCISIPSRRDIPLAGPPCSMADRTHLMPSVPNRVKSFP